MKLSELIYYRNLLDTLSATPIWKHADSNLSVILNLVSTHNLQIGDLTKQLTDNYTVIHQSFDTFEHTLEQLKLQLQQQIGEAEKPWFVDSYKEHLQFEEDNEKIKTWMPQLSEEHTVLYRNRVIRYTGWKHAAMIIRPGFESFIDDLVACDPLYLVDVDYDLFKPAMERYNHVYQNRLRPYVVNEKQDGPILGRLPDNQFGLILAYNFLNFRPFEVVQRWLSECYQKLKPGGTLVMTFNDCDRYKAVILAEKYYSRYTPGKMVRNWAQYVGFEETFCHHDDGPITWLELQKPGELTSLRGGQALAEILPKPVA